MSDFWVALRFLTVIPLGKAASPLSYQEMVRSLNYYSLVGLLLGGVIALISTGTSYLDLGLSGDVIIVAALSLLTGGLHLDGLADTADGVLNCRAREEKLAIMRDSRIGAMGAIALWIVLMLKVSLLGEFAFPEKLRLVWFIPAMGRCAMVWSAVRFPYARASGGLGSFSQGAGKASLYVNAGIIVVAGVLLLGISCLAIIIVVMAFAHLLAMVLSKRLGGLTGDTYGAVCELCETLTLLMGTVIGL